MPVIRTKRLEVPMENTNSGWTVVMTHETGDEAVHVALHYGEKPDPTHEGWVPLADLKEMFEDAQA